MILLAAGGNGGLSASERDWLTAYLVACGESDRVLDALANYDDADTIEDILRRRGMANTGRGLLYDAIRVCAADGPLTSDELDRLRHAADAIGVPREVFDELSENVRAQHALRQRRYELIVAPVLPGSLRVADGTAG